MSRTQKTILTIGFLLIALDCLYPPYMYVIDVHGHIGTSEPIGRRLLFKQGFSESFADASRRIGLKPFENGEFCFTRLNYKRLSLEVSSVGLVTGLLIGILAILRRRAANNPSPA